MNQTNTPYLVMPCDNGKLHKLDLSKYTKRIQRGLQKDYGIRAELNSEHIGPHNCPTCSKRCKADNGEGTQKATELIEIVGRRQQILDALVSYDKPTTLNEVNLWLNTAFGIVTTEKATGSRVSELLYWKLVERVSIDGPTAEADIYPDTNAGAFFLNKPRVEILKRCGWQTWILRAIDSGLSWDLSNFAEEG